MVIVNISIKCMLLGRVVWLFFLWLLVVLQNVFVEERITKQIQNMFLKA